MLQLPMASSRPAEAARGAFGAPVGFTPLEKGHLLPGVELSLIHI